MAPHQAIRPDNRKSLIKLVFDFNCLPISAKQFRACGGAFCGPPIGKRHLVQQLNQEIETKPPVRGGR